MTDMVNNPPHYQLGNGMEVIDFIEAALTPEEFRGYLKGNDIKYIYREPFKGNSEQDVAKSIWYAERYKEALAKKAEAEEKKSEAKGFPVSDVEFLDIRLVEGHAPTQRVSAQISPSAATLLMSQMYHPAYADHELVLTWRKK